MKYGPGWGLIVGSAAITAACGAARAQVIDSFWTTPTNGNWEDAIRWSTNPAYPNNDSPPGSHYRAVFQATGASHTINLVNRDITLDDVLMNSANATLRLGSGGRLNLVNQFDLRAGTFRLDGGEFSGVIALNGGRLEANNFNFSVLRDVRLIGAWNVATSGRVRIAGSAFDFDQINIAGGSLITFDNSMTLSHGSITQTAGSSAFVLGIEANSTLTLGPNFTLRMAQGTIGDPQSTNGIGSRLVNEGSIIADSAGRTVGFSGDQSRGAWLTNRGLIRAENGGRIEISDYVLELGTLEAQGPGSTIVSTPRNSLDVRALATGPITASDGATISLGGRWAGTDDTVISTVNGGRVSLAGNFAAPVLDQCSGAAGSVRLEGLALNTGTVTFHAGSTVVLAGGEIDGGIVETDPSVVLPLLNGTTSTLRNVVFAGQADVRNSTLVLEDAWSVTGTINAGDNGTVDLGGVFTTPQLAAISRSGTGVVRVIDTWNALGETVNFAPNALVTAVRGGATVDATEINVAPGHTFNNAGSLRASSFTGSGTISLETAFNTGALQPNSADNAMTIGADLTVTGSGRIDGLGARVTSEGTIRVQPGGKIVVYPAEFTNSGLLEVAGGELFLGNPSTTDPTPAWTNTGTVHVSSGTLLLAGSYRTQDIGTINNTGGTVGIGGILDNRDATLVVPAGNGTWSTAIGRIIGGEIEVRPGASFALTSTQLEGVHLSGAFQVNSATVKQGLDLDGSLTFLTTSTLNFVGDQTLASGEIIAPGQGTCRLLCSGNSSLTLGPGVVVRGGGAAFGNNDESSRSTGVFVNQGAMIADLPGRKLTINPDTFINQGVLEARDGGILDLIETRGTNAEWTNTGVIRAVNGGRVELAGRVSTPRMGTLDTAGGTLVFDGLSLDNSGYTLHIDETTGSVLSRSAFIKGGVIDIAPGYTLTVSNFPTTFQAVTVRGDVFVNQRYLAVSNGLTVDGTIHLNGPGAGLYFRGANNTVTSGTISFEGDPGDDRFLAGDSSNLSSFIIGPDVVVHGGRGAIMSNNDDTVDNRGLISSDVSGLKITIYTYRFFNTGTVQAINGGIVQYVPPLGPGGGSFVNANILLLDQGSALEIFGDLVNEPGGRIRVCMSPGDTSPLSVSGTVFLAGGMDLLTPLDWSPQRGDVFQLFTAGSFEGAFDEVHLPTLADGLAWHTASLGITGRIWVVPAPAAALPLLGLLPLLHRRRSSRSSS